MEWVIFSFSSAFAKPLRAAWTAPVIPRAPIPGHAQLAYPAAHGGPGAAGGRAMG